MPYICPNLAFLDKKRENNFSFPCSIANYTLLLPTKETNKAIHNDENLTHSRPHIGQATKTKKGKENI